MHAERLEKSRFVVPKSIEVDSGSAGPIPLVIFRSLPDDRQEERCVCRLDASSPGKILSVDAVDGGRAMGNNRPMCYGPLAIQ